jgi:DNA polymerase-1
MEQIDIFNVLDVQADATPEPIEAELSEPKKKLTYEDFDYDKLNVYAGIDCIATIELLKKQMPIISTEETKVELNSRGMKMQGKAPAIIESFHKYEIPAQEFLIDLELNGMRYSVPRNKWYADKMQEEVAGLDDKIFTGIGKRIDLNSGTKVAAFLYEERGFKPPTFTKSGDPATDGQALMMLAGLDPTGNKYVTADPAMQWLADMAKRRDIWAVYNTFIKSYVRDFVKRDGRLHPSYNQFGTSSFRITGSDPNLTQLPRARHGYNIRTCYIVDEGTVFISFDFSSAEMKVLANIAKESAMLKAIADGLDFHSFSASAMKKIPYDEFVGVLSDKTNPLFKEYKEYRQVAKILGFSIIYGASVAGIANQLNLTKDLAQELVDMYFKAFPKIKDYIENSHKFALHNQYVITPIGQRRRMYGTYPCFKPTAAYNASLRSSQNGIIQSVTSSIGLAAFTELNNRVKELGAKSICTVYDSIEIECPINKAAEVINLGYEVLNNYPQEAFSFMELPIGSEADCGFSWGETEVVHEGVTQDKITEILNSIKQDSIKNFGSWLY